MAEHPAVVFVPCPGRLACPERLFEVDGHQHFRRAEPATRVRRLMPGCWEVCCRRCAFLTNTGFVAQAATWERAMLRAGEHVREVHGD